MTDRTRKAGGLKNNPSFDLPPTVIVDVREFRSSLPSFLHSRGLHLIPVTLEIGDYLLSPLICIERKGIPDLFGSFSSGRLYSQIEAMIRVYKTPVLLIEFDAPNKPFSLTLTDENDSSRTVNAGHGVPGINPRAITSKLALLVLHFPQLRLLWSRNSMATANLVVALKQDQPQPALSDAVLTTNANVSIDGGGDEGGDNGDGGGGGGAADDGDSNGGSTPGLTPFDILKKLPGLQNQFGLQRVIIDKCGSLSEMCNLPLQELSGLIGTGPARKLYNFVHDDHARAFGGGGGGGGGGVAASGGAGLSSTTTVAASAATATAARNSGGSGRGFAAGSVGGGKGSGSVPRTF